MRRSTATQERIAALKDKEAALIDKAGADGFDGDLKEVRVQLEGLRDQRQFLEEQDARATDGEKTRTEQVSPADIDPDKVGVELSDEMAAAQEELDGRLEKDRAYGGLRLALEAEGGLPDQEKMLLMLASDSATEFSKVPLGQQGEPAVTIRLGAARAFQRFLEQPGSPTIRDYLDLQLAYTTAAGTSAGNLGDTIPTLKDTMFNQIDQAINGIRRVPGVDIRMTPTADAQEWPLFIEAGISTLAHNKVGEGVAAGGDQRREGYAEMVTTEPIEFIGWAEVTKTVLAKSAVPLIPAIMDGLARTGARITERAFATGDGTAGATGEPEGIFRVATGNNVQAGTGRASTLGAAGRANTDEILGLPGEITDLEMDSDIVWALHRTAWYNWIRRLKESDVGYSIGGNPDGQIASTPGLGSVKVIDGAPAYFFNYAPTTTGATDYYLILFLPQAYRIHEWENLEILRDDSVGFLKRAATFLVSRWVDSVWVPTSGNTQARASIQGNSS